MWNLALRLLLDQARKEPFRRVGKTIAGTLFPKELNAPEVYVERIKRDHRIAPAGARGSVRPADIRRLTRMPPTGR